MSLTGHLRDRHSPVRRWLHEHLGATSRPARDANRALTGGRSLAPLSYGGRHPQLAGTAIDLLARATLRADALEHSGPVRRGARVIVDPSRPTAALDVEQNALAALRDAVQPAGGAIAWREAAATALVVAELEQAARSMRAAHTLIARLRGATPTLDGYRAALVDEDEVDELARVAPAVAEDLADLAACSALQFDCELAQSGPLGGAAPDLIADGALLDVKASSSSAIVTGPILHQLCGYVLADTDDRYRIRSVGIVAARWRTRHIWPVGELFAALGETAVELDAMRAEFAAVVASARRAARRR